jgi:hypothetical protein
LSVTHYAAFHGEPIEYRAGLESLLGSCSLRQRTGVTPGSGQSVIQVIFIDKGYLDDLPEDHYLDKPHSGLLSESLAVYQIQSTMTFTKFKDWFNDAAFLARFC